MTGIPEGQTTISARWTIKYADIQYVWGADGYPRFVAKDICDYLDIKDPSTAYSRIDEEDKELYPIATAGGTQNMLIVTEPGLYQLIFMSTKPEAKDFRRWVFRELLPELRRKGQYKLRNGSGQRLMPALAESKTYGGSVVTQTRFGRQPILDVLRARGLKNDESFKAMDDLDLPGILHLNTTYMDQARGRAYVKPPLATRASAYLNLPVEELFTEASRARLPRPA